MARMIPSVIDDASPPGERTLFARFKSEAATSGWTVLHSLSLAEHPTQVEGEADFVIIVPGRGVAVIEVKSHTSVSRAPDGLWVLGRDASRRRSPFEQANGAMRAIMEYARKKGFDTRPFPFVYGVWFTNVRARSLLPQTPEWKGWQLLDSEDLRGEASNAVLRLLHFGREHLESHGVRWVADTPDAAGCDALASMLRPRFDLVASPSDIRNNRQKKLLELLDEQYEALDAMADNRACLFNGPAGSGKTLLAIEQSRRDAASGSTGWLVCFNRLLGSQLSQEFPAGGNVSAGTLSSLMLHITGLPVPVGADKEFWEGTLVNAALERLLVGDLARDFLVLDEAQDLLREPFWDVLALMVKDGLNLGRCVYFGDFIQQALYGSSDGRRTLRELAPSTAFNRLSANCRNLPRIGVTAEALASMDPGYSRYRRVDDGVQPTYKWYSTADEQQAHLVDAVRLLKAEGFRQEDIIILSPRKSSSAAATCTDGWLKPLIIEEGTHTPRPGRVRFTTIHAFKGLEAPAVVLTDFDDATLPGMDSLLYVGLTRATDRLVVIATKDALSHLL